MCGKQISSLVTIILCTCFNNQINSFQNASSKINRMLKENLVENLRVYTMLLLHVNLRPPMAHRKVATGHLRPQNVFNILQPLSGLDTAKVNHNEKSSISYINQKISLYSQTKLLDISQKTLYHPLKSV